VVFIGCCHCRKGSSSSGSAGSGSGGGVLTPCCAGFTLPANATLTFVGCGSCTPTSIPMTLQPAVPYPQYKGHLPFGGPGCVIEDLFVDCPGAPDFAWRLFGQTGGSCPIGTSCLIVFAAADSSCSPLFIEFRNVPRCCFGPDTGFCDVILTL